MGFIKQETPAGSANFLDFGGMAVGGMTGILLDMQVKSPEDPVEDAEIAARNDADSRGTELQDVALEARHTVSGDIGAAAVEGFASSEPYATN